MSTTISSKHYAILVKNVKKYGTHQKVLERALNNLELNPQKNAPLSREEELWIRMGKDLSSSLAVIQIDAFNVIAETVDFDRFRKYVDSYRPVEFAIEYIYQKPLKKCCLTELIEGLILNLKMQNTYDTVNYSDEGDCYMLSLTHSLGLNASKMLQIMHDSVFDTYGVKTESCVSERSVFTTIYKIKEKS